MKRMRDLTPPRDPSQEGVQSSPLDLRTGLQTSPLDLSTSRPRHSPAEKSPDLKLRKPAEKRTETQDLSPKRTRSGQRYDSPLAKKGRGEESSEDGQEAELNGESDARASPPHESSPRGLEKADHQEEETLLKEPAQPPLREPSQPRDSSSPQGESDESEDEDTETSVEDLFRVDTRGPPRRFKRALVEQTYVLRFADIDTILQVPQEELVELLKNILEAGFRRIAEQAPPGSIGQIVCRNIGFNHRAFGTRRQRVEELKFDEIADKLDKKLKSGDEVHLEDTEFDFMLYNPAEVGGLGATLWNRRQVNITEFKKKSGSIMDPAADNCRIPEDMQSQCLPICVAVALWRYENPMKWGHQKFQRSCECWKRAKQLALEAGLTPKGGPYELSAIAKIQRAQGDNVQILLFNLGGSLLHEAGPDSADILICLLYLPPPEPAECENTEPKLSKPSLKLEGGEGHVCLITKVAAFLGRARFCRLCRKGHNQRNEGVHKCGAANDKACGSCGWVICKNRDGNPPPHPTFPCCACGATFTTPHCLTAHEENGRCAEFEKCRTCGQLFKRKEGHKCGHTQGCGICKTSHLTSSRCHVQRPKKRKKPGRKKKRTSETGESDEQEEESKRRIFYADIEATIDKYGRHRPELMVVQYGESDDGQEWVFKGPNCIKSFIGHVLENELFKGGLLYMHYSRGYDSVFILQALLELQLRPENVIMRGTQLLSLKIPNIGLVLHDSHMFLDVPLRKFATLFDLQVAKGDYPFNLGAHWLDWTETVYYEEDGLRFPHWKYFECESASAEECERRKKWHSEMAEEFAQDPSKHWCPSQEMLKYCQLDVQVLRIGFSKFVTAWAAACPDISIHDYVSMPSFINARFRSTYMPTDSIAILPQKGYDVKNRPQSLEAFGWLAYQYETMALEDVRDGRHGGEIVIAGLHLDGWAWSKQLQTFVAMEYNGYHTNYATTYLCSVFPMLDSWLPWMLHGGGADSGDGSATPRRWPIWSDWSESPGPPTLPFPNSNSSSNGPASGGSNKPRIPKFEAFWCNAVKHHVKKRPGKKLKYYDVNSLYPSVQASLRGEEYVLGYPTIYIGRETRKAPELKNSLGLWKVRIRPPRSLYFPVVPLKWAGQLYFPLCKTCLEEGEKGLCEHNDEEREFVTTLATPELQLAARMGYLIVEKLEIWDWAPEQRSTTLFKGIIADFYKQKVLASKPPSCPVEMERLITNLRERLGVVITPDEIRPDPVQRSNSKRAVNCIWGYLSMKGRQVSTEFIRDEDRLHQLENDPDIRVKSMRVEVEDKVARVQYEPTTEKYQCNGSIVLGLLTTSWARVKLYEEALLPFGEAVMYFDTDSVIVELDEDESEPELGNCIGDLSDERPGEEILEFVALGSKSYSLRCLQSDGQEKTGVRFKGISLGKKAAEVVNHDSMKLLMSNRTSEKKVAQFRIQRDYSEGYKLRSKSLKKVIRFTSKKRNFLPDPNPELKTIPIGTCL